MGRREPREELLAVGYWLRAGSSRYWRLACRDGGTPEPGNQQLITGDHELTADKAVICSTP